MIKTIFFDIGGVLIDIHPERTYQYISDSADLDINTVKELFPWDAHDEYERGMINNEDWFTTYKEALPQPCCLKSSDFWNAWRLLLGEEKNTIKILEDLNNHMEYLLLRSSNILIVFFSSPNSNLHAFQKSELFKQHGCGSASL